MAWHDRLPAWRCGQKGCVAIERQWVEGAARNDLEATKRAYEAHQATEHADQDDEGVDRAAELLVA